MFATIQLLTLGVAALIDTIVLLALTERRNRGFVQLPLLLLVVAVWLWHTGLLALALLLSTWAAPACLLCAVTGLLLMPCALSHALVRIWRTGLARRAGPDPRHALIYLPLAALVPLATRLDTPPPDQLLAPLLPYALPYIACSGLLSALAAVTFLRLAPRSGFPAARPFFILLAWLFLAKSLLQGFVFLVVRDAWPQWDSYALLACILSPAPAMLAFATFVVRHDFLHLVPSRSLVYAGLIAVLVLVHQLLLQEVSAAIPHPQRAGLVFLEVITVATLIGLLPPLRQRAAEALRYLLGERLTATRERLRRLAVAMTAQAGRQPLELLEWFSAELQAALEVDFIATWLFHGDGTIRARCGATERVQFDDADCRTLVAAKVDADQTWACLQQAGASLALTRTHRQLTALILIGRHSRKRELATEEVNAVYLLVEQLVLTLDHALLQAERLDAERRAAQAERLSTLGLLAGSLAHEIKNPLSAIKTIATVLAEDLGEGSPYAEDMRLIRSEIERLAQTTAQLLDFARSGVQANQAGCVGAVLNRIVLVLGRLARQRDVSLVLQRDECLPRVGADEASLREIFFNLLANAVEAAGLGGRVTVTCAADNGSVVTEVSDTGPGLAPEVRARLFEPFLTTKDSGTGLGLYVVGRRVRELGGTIGCSGSTFSVRLPAVDEASRERQRPDEPLPHAAEPVRRSGEKVG